MRSILKVSVVLLIVIAMLLTCFCSCATTGKTLLELEGTEMSVNTFMLLLSRMKGTLASSIGDDITKDSFWDTVIDASSGRTYCDHYTDIVMDSAKTYLAALHLFEELELKLPDSYIDEIDKELEELIDYDANGSRSELNSKLSEFGANYNVLRDAYIMEAKIAYLNDHLFGANGEKIGENLYEDYYRENYVRFKNIFFYTVKPRYVRDANDDDIYYTEDGRIAYDKENGKKLEKDGVVVRDTNGDIVFVKEDGSIAYDEKNGIPKPQLDKDGNTITDKLSTEEMIALTDKTTLIMEQLGEGEYALFDSMIEKYNEDEGMTQYPNGYYLTATSDYAAPNVRDELFVMEVGEIKKIESEYGIHIVMKYELEEQGYAKQENADFFLTNSGALSFLPKLKTALMSEHLEKYMDKIVVDEERLKGVNIKIVGANFNY